MAHEASAGGGGAKPAAQTVPSGYMAAGRSAGSGSGTAVGPTSAANNNNNNVPPAEVPGNDVGSNISLTQTVGTRNVGSGKSGSGGSGGGYSVNTKLNIPEGSSADAAAARRNAVKDLIPDTEPVNMDRVNYYDRQYLTDLATQEIEAERQRQNQQIDRTMDTQAAQLNRALADAQGQFQVQQNQVAANEQNALDNAALYAEARGDRGGIGQAQYNSIQNTAAQNRLAVSQAQTKLATDTARQISDLRAQGEFDRADKMLELTQTYLSELRAIEQYAANYNLSVDQMNTAIAEWEADFNRASQQYAANMELSLAQVTGAFSDGTPTYQAYKDTLNAQASLALNMIQAGVKPTQLSSSQLSALAQAYGMDQTAINAMYLRAKK